MTLRKLKYKPSVHAVERMREYLGIKEIHAVDFANELMVDAQFVLRQDSGRRLFKNDKHDVMIVLDAVKNTLITILPSQEKRKEIAEPAQIKEETPAVEAGNNPVINAARSTVQRELTKARRLFTRETRALKLEIAEIGVEIAQAVVNKVRCKHPATQAIIQRNIDALQANSDSLTTELESKQAAYTQMRREAAEFIGEEVTV